MYPLQTLPYSHLGRLKQHAYSQKQLQYFAQLFYVLSFGFCRVSYAQFIGSVARGSPLARRARSLTLVAGIWTVVSVIILAYDGRPSMPWTGTLKRPLVSFILFSFFFTFAFLLRYSRYFFSSLLPVPLPSPFSSYFYRSGALPILRHHL